MEMSEKQLTDRMICSEARVDSGRVRSGFFSPDEWMRIGAAASAMRDVRMVIDHTASMTIHELRSKCRRIHAEGGLSLVCIDYLQLLSGTPGKKVNRTEEVGEIARGLKILSRELHIPVIALAQLSRAVEQRQEKKPMLSDLRESGDCEASADVVIFLYRESYYKHGKEEDEDPYASDDFEKAEWVIAKNRNGPTGTIPLGWIGKYTRFEEISKVQRTPDAYSSPYADD
jgi:replicative DNA helicase